VRTFRGGDRPKGGEREFPHVCAMPRSAWEPWGLFRRPLDGTLVNNLRAWGVGGLRRTSEDSPFCDVIASTKTPRRERDIADHPSLKPQAFLRLLVRATLPMEAGVVLDPFMGAGSTIAACHACGIRSVGLELRADYFATAERAIPRLAALETGSGIARRPADSLAAS
jgi:site-specific DNA-methyltransferase (adenine-specific)